MSEMVSNNLSRRERHGYLVVGEKHARVVSELGRSFCLAWLLRWSSDLGLGGGRDVLSFRSKVVCQ